MARSSSGRLYPVLEVVVRPAVRRAYRITVDGLERVPVAGPVILAPNHRSFMDSVFLATVVPRRVAFVAKAQYFERWQTRWLFTGTGQIPLRRGSPRAAQEAFTAARQVLDDGGVIGIYPEGTRSRDGRLHRGNAGAARLAAATGAPIVPIGLVGTDAVQEIGRRVPRVGREVRLTFGEHVEPPTGDAPRVLRDVTDRLMRDIARLSGQEYDDRFAAVSA